MCLNLDPSLDLTKVTCFLTQNPANMFNYDLFFKVINFTQVFSITKYEVDIFSTRDISINCTGDYTSAYICTGLLIDQQYTISIRVTKCYDEELDYDNFTLYPQGNHE